MPARQSNESKWAMALVDSGMAVPLAAVKTGMDPSTIYKRLKAVKKRKIKKKIARGNE